MGDKYLFNQSGIVENVILPGKAILTFTLNNQEQRVLLWIKSYVHQGKHLGADDTFNGKLKPDEKVTFDCHTYDRESRDKCQWYAASARKEVAGECQTKVTQVVNQTGRVSELDPGKGVILFDVHEQEHRVFFMRSKFYHFEKRPGNKHSLTEFLSENDPVQFDAQQCEPAKSNKNSTWFSTLVWKGKKPKGVSNTWTTSGGNAEDMYNEEGKTTKSFNDEDDFPNLSLPPGLTERHGYKAFEVNNSTREGKAYVLTLINEECGIALWMIQLNAWETVFFHRKCCYLSDVHLSKYDLQESFCTGSIIQVAAVLAVPDFPCKWIAKKASLSNLQSEKSERAGQPISLSSKWL